MKKNLTILIVVMVIVIVAALVWPHPLHTPAPMPGTQATSTPKVVPSTASSTAGFMYKNATADLITVELPYPGAVTGKAFSVIGKARGQWFFEGSFPVVVLDANGKVLAQGQAKANGEWMTTNFVPFKADITVPTSYIGKATLVLKKDNPSGMPEKDASVSFEVTVEY